MPLPRRLGVCSWSLRPSSPRDLADKLRQLDVDACQLALDPLRAGHWKLGETVAALRAAAVEIRSGMMGLQGEDYSTLDTIRMTGGVRPTQHWPANLAIARADAALASELGLALVSFHAGFLPHAARDPERATLLERLRTIVDVFAERGVRIAFETGQETAATLAAVLDELDRPSAGVNFDPANMLLYGTGDPVAALRGLAPRVRQVHVKDALRSATPGAWGSEVVVGTGQVDWPACLRVLDDARLAVDLMIEREAGENRAGDIATAREFVARHVTLGAAR